VVAEVAQALLPGVLGQAGPPGQGSARKCSSPVILLGRLLGRGEQIGTFRSGLVALHFVLSIWAGGGSCQIGRGNESDQCGVSSPCG